MNTNTAGSLIGAVLAFVVWAVIYVLVYGWALSKLWLWFIVPVFDVPALPILNAVGLSIFVAALRSPNLSDLAKNEVPAEELGYAMMAALFRPVFVVGLAWLLTLFM